MRRSAKKSPDTGSAYERASAGARVGDCAASRGIEPAGNRREPAAIQRFEFCFELAWKAIQERARAEGLDCQSPRGCLRVAFKASWIEDDQGWLAMLADRNQTLHTYDEDLAKAVYGRLRNYLPLLDARTNKLAQ